MSASAPEGAPNFTLLIVDDDALVRTNLRRVFEDAGFRALTAEDAPAALRLIHKEQCDLVLLDLEMPGVDGFALCRLLRAQSATSKLPVIAFSASDDEARKVQAFTAGADDYITKPSSAGELVSRVSSHLRAAQREWALLGSNRELRFLADLGRGLLRTLEPDQLVRRVAGATYDGTGAQLCAAFVRLNETTQAGCVFDREGSAEDESLLHADRMQRWITAAGNMTPVLLTNPKDFLIRDDTHKVEYAAPLRFGGRTKGVLVIAFDNAQDCGETECRLVEAAVQQAALAAHISSLYLEVRSSSESLAREVDQRTAEAEAQRRFTDAILDSLPLSLYAIDREYRIAAWNRNRELGELGMPREDVMGKNLYEVLTRQRRETLQREFAHVFETGGIKRVEQETLTAEGETRHWLVSKIPMWANGGDEVTHVIAVGEDITARVEANRAVARAEKLAAVGRLASGVVHEINNPLATISACAEALESRVREGAFAGSEALGDLVEYLGLIRSEAFRCKTITTGLLNFSRTRAARRRPIDLSEVISSAARLVAHQKRGEGIEIQLKVEDALAPVSGDSGQLQQAVIALATNAIDAMPEGGILTISARNRGEQVLVDVSDTGVGIAPENLPKIFEPFFTTKEVGHGTGLGLAVCYGILTEHGGGLDVQSTVGAGTTFTITLPAINQSNIEE
jgi:two-component system NtrC family sensor kinase